MPGRFRETLETVGGCLIYIAFSAIPILLLIALFKSMRWIAEVVLPICSWVGGIGLVLVPIFLIFAIPRMTRGWAGLGITLSSYAIGLSLWVWSLVIAYTLAGTTWMIIGLLFAGVGVIAIAAIAAALHAEWLVFIEIIVSIFVIWLLRFLGAYLVEKAEPKEEYLPPLPPQFSG
jgi:hypothetical protein